MRIYNPHRHMSERISNCTSIDRDKLERFKVLLSNALSAGHSTEEENAAILSILAKVEAGTELAEQEETAYQTISKKINALPSREEVFRAVQMARDVVLNEVPAIVNDVSATENPQVSAK